jgi:RHS repeat-associated protein
VQAKTYVPIHDSSGNLVLLLDNQGQIIEKHSYSAFGEEESTLSISPWKHSSKRYDPETGFYYFGRRYYAPEIGRWISPYPAGFVDGFNLYAYVHNSPLIHIDPDGQFAFLIPIAISLAISHAAELALPTVVTSLQQYTGEAYAAALLSGIVQGYTGNSGSFFSADPSLGLIENSSWALGTIIAYNPIKLSSSAIKNAMCSEMATKATSATFSRAFNWYSKHCSANDKKFHSKYN